MSDTIFEPEIKRSLSWVQQMSGGMLASAAFECKKCQEPRLSFDRVKDHQVEGLLSFQKNGIVRKLVVSQGFGAKARFTGDTPFDFLFVEKGIGYVLVNFRFTKKSPRSDIPKGTNKCFALPIQDYIDAKDSLSAEGKASIPYDWFLNNAIELQRIRITNSNNMKESAWDLTKLLIREEKIW